MKRHFLVLGGIAVLLLTAIDSNARDRDRAPDKISVFAAAGGVFPLGSFDDAATSGTSYSVGGFYRLTDYVVPAFFFQQAFMKTEIDNSAAESSINAYNLVAGLRFYLLPESARLRPWVSLLGGWGHYSVSGRTPAPGLFAPNRNDRDDVMVVPGGGLELRLNSNFSFAFDVRYNLSVTDSSGSSNEDSLSAISMLGGITLHY